MRLVKASTVLLCLGLAACAPKAIVANPTAEWRSAATPADREKLRNWRDAFTDALREARLTNAQEVAAEGALLEPDAALGGPIPNGDYRCRVIKLGSQSPGMLHYVAYPAFACRVGPSGRVQSFAKLTGSQRPVGLLFPNDALRQVFLGTMVLGDEVRAMQYGTDPDRDIAAFVERIGPARWRMLIPSPAFESKTDVIELVPAS